MDPDVPDKAASAWTTEHTNMIVELDAKLTVVTTTLALRRLLGDGGDELVLDGVNLTLVEMAVDGEALTDDDFDCDDRHLRLHMGTRDKAFLETTVMITPGSRYEMGLVGGCGRLNTVMEPTGLRHLTYCMDRPTVRSTYTITVVADPSEYRDTYANGRLVAELRRPDGRVARTFEDPVPKPSYLVAVLAGTFESKSAVIALEGMTPVQATVLGEPDVIDGAAFALETLHDVMAFDAAQGGIPYDMDCLLMAAVAGYRDATEYHGLMFFEPSLLLLDQRGWSDDDVTPILANIAHEYFHHTRGNRITVSAWRQLALKEGLTVLAQGEFRLAMEGPAARLDEVAFLRRAQYPEEALHGFAPVRAALADPSAAYTGTTYLKGAEIFRMLRSVAGIDAWNRAVQAFQASFDLSAASVADFVAELRSACPERADAIEATARWFHHVGRPAVKVEVQRNAEGMTVTLVRVGDLVDDEPVAIPIEFAFIGRDGHICESEMAGSMGTSHQVLLGGRSKQLVVRTRPDAVVSALRGFSAPIDLEIDQSAEELATLLAYESDAYARWSAAQKLKAAVVDAFRSGEDARAQEVGGVLASALLHVLDHCEDPALLAKLLEVPSEVALGDATLPIDVDGVHAGVAHLAKLLGVHVGPRLVKYVEGDGTHTTDSAQRAVRSLSDAGIALLLARGEPDDWNLAARIVAEGDSTRATRTLRHALAAGHPDSEELIALSESRWTGAPRLLDRWTRAQTGAGVPETISRVCKLVAHSRYDRQDRSRVMAVWFPFCTENRVIFHEASGSGYELFVDEVERLVQVNPGLLPRLATDLFRFKSFDARRQGLMRIQLERVLAFEHLDPMVKQTLDRVLSR